MRSDIGRKKTELKNCGEKKFVGVRFGEFPSWRLDTDYKVEDGFKLNLCFLSPHKLIIQVQKLKSLINMVTSIHIL